MAREIGVGLIGLGVVGGGAARALIERQEYFARQVGAPLIVRRAAVRDLSKPRTVTLPDGALTTDVQAIISDPSIDIVVEVIGGEEPAGSFIRAALAAGKHVVTANKELMAKSGPELLADAHARGLDIMFEASVGGGIPRQHHREHGTFSGFALHRDLATKQARHTPRDRQPQASAAKLARA